MFIDCASIVPYALQAFLEINLQRFVTLLWTISGHSISETYALFYLYIDTGWSHSPVGITCISLGRESASDGCSVKSLT
jgi:hypothetical protein